jgi:aspartate aminotransferase
MLTLSEKAKKMPASPIRKLVPYADAAKKRGIKVYHLNIGQPDIPSPKEALDAVKNNQLKLVALSQLSRQQEPSRRTCKILQGESISTSIHLA